MMKDLTYPVATSHILRVLSLEEETRKSPDGMKQSDDTLWSWPCRVLIHSYVVQSHNRMDMSAEQEATKKKKKTFSSKLQLVTSLVTAMLPLLC